MPSPISRLIKTLSVKKKLQIPTEPQYARRTLIQKPIICPFSSKLLSEFHILTIHNFIFSVIQLFYVKTWTIFKSSIFGIKFHFGKVCALNPLFILKQGEKMWHRQFHTFRFFLPFDPEEKKLHFSFPFHSSSSKITKLLEKNGRYPNFFLPPIRKKTQWLDYVGQLQLTRVDFVVGFNVGSSIFQFLHFCMQSHGWRKPSGQIGGIP